MDVKKEKMLEAMRQAEKLDFRRIVMGETRPVAYGKAGIINIQKSPRFILPLTGTKRMRFALDGEARDRIFVPGEVLFCPPNAWSAEVWDRPHKMISIVFRGRYIRTLFIEHDGKGPIPHPEVFYHTASPLSVSGGHLLHAVLSARRDAESQLLGFRALLRNVIETVENDRDPRLGKESFTWECVQDYLESNFNLAVSRSSAGKALHLHPATLSRLVRKMTGCGFTEYLSRLRLERARDLLEETNLTVDEIADQCGYRYTSYFIRKFRDEYSESPFRFRAKYKAGRRES